jgi:hypothetical protein
VAAVTPRLEALREAVLEVAKVAREVKETPPPAPVVNVPPGTDLTPYLQHLAKLLRALTDRMSQAPVAAPAAAAAAAPDLGLYMEQLTKAVAAMAERPVQVAPALQRAAAVPSPVDLPRQVTLIQAALEPLERAAKRSLQSGEEDIKAMQVWQSVTEALALVQAMIMTR